MDSPAENPKNLSKEQKIGFVLLLVFGIVAVALGLLQMRNTIYSPFVFHLSKDYTPPVSEEEKLKSLDTDRDGLSDYDELYVYNTSPYLADTDSDGVLDKMEIDKGTDPLCPEGQSCGLDTEGAMNTSTPELVTSPLMNETMPSNIFGQMGLVNDSNTVNFLDMANILKDPPRLRKMLVENGQMDPAVLAEISDEDLIKMVNEMVYGQNSASVQLPVANNSLTDLSQMEDLMTNPQKLRELLLNTGKITSEKLSKISNEELLKMAKDAWSMPNSVVATSTTAPANH